MRRMPWCVARAVGGGRDERRDDGIRASAGGDSVVREWVEWE
jgi:hypothetical protein